MPTNKYLDGSFALRILEGSSILSSSGRSRPWIVLFLAALVLAPVSPFLAVVFEGPSGIPASVRDYRVTGVPPPLPRSASDRLTFSTYLGGAGNDQADAIAIDGNDNVYVVGSTATPGLAPTSGAFDTTLGGEFDGFVAKLNATGAVAFITYIGGSGSDIVLDVSVGGSGSVFISGSTDSADFPTTVNGFDRTYNGGRDGFVAELSGDGTALLYATYLGGTGRDEAAHLALSTSGQVYLAGSTFSSDFPTTLGAYNPAIVGGGSNIFVSRLDLGTGTLVFSTYLGGGLDDSVTDVALDTAGNAIVVGATDSQDFPTTAAAFDATLAGTDGFVAKLMADGSSLLYSSFVGGSNTDWVIAAAVTANGVVHATGYTVSTDFPTTEGALSRSYRGGLWDAFVLWLDLQGGLLYSIYLGGAGDDFGRDIAVDSTGATYAIGSTASSDFPTTPTAISTIHSGFADAYFLKLDSSGGSISYSTYFGGSGSDLPAAFALDGKGNFSLTGATSSADLPVTGGAYSTTLAGSQDAFLAKARILEPTTPPGGGAATFPWILVIGFLGGAAAAVAVVVWLRSRRHRKGPGPPEAQAPGKSS